MRRGDRPPVATVAHGPMPAFPASPIVATMCMVLQEDSSGAGSDADEPAAKRRKGVRGSTRAEEGGGAA